MRAAAAAERLRRPSRTAIRRSGVMRGSEAPLTKGSSRAWDPDRAAREAGERASRSGLRPNANGGGKRCEHPEEAYADMRYRSADKVCPVCKGHVTPRAVEPERAHQRGRSTSQPCQHPEEAYTDARYRNNDSVCPVCAGWLPSKKHSAENKPSCSDAQERTSKAMDKVWGPGALPPRAMPRKWRTCGADEVWEQQGPHQGRSRPALQQRAAQRAVAHTERNPQQQYELGCRLEREGEDVTRPVADREADLQQAVGWFRAAAFQGHTKALHRLGLCLLSAKGVAKDERQAVTFLRKAAFSEADAAFELGNCYYHGVGHPRNEDEALGWWRVALGMGHLKALGAIKDSSESSSAKAERGRTARLQYLATCGDMDAQFQVAGRLFEGRTLIKDEAAAVNLYQLASSQGHVEAMSALGLCFYFGRGVATDQAKAVKWLTCAAQLGHGIAQRALAYMYQEGTGLPRDVNRAETLLKQAAKWQEKRMSKFYFEAAQGPGGTITAPTSSLHPFVGYLRTRVEEVRQLHAVTVMARRMLAGTLTRNWRNKQLGLILSTLEAPTDWRAARAGTLMIERNLHAMYAPLCMLVGQDPRALTYKDTCAIVEDLDAVAALAGAADELELSWSVDQVSWDDFVKKGGADGGGSGGRKLKAGDHVEFLVSFDRASQTLAAIAVRKVLTGNAPPPGSVCVWPSQGRDMVNSSHEAADRALHDLKQVEADLLSGVRAQARGTGGGVTGFDDNGDEEGGVLARRRLALAKLHAQHVQKTAGLEGVRLAEDEGGKTGMAHTAGAMALQKTSVMAALAQLPVSKSTVVRGRVASVARGDADAQVEYGIRLLTGLGVVQDASRAVDYFELAAEQGQPLAHCALAICWASGQGVDYADKIKACAYLEHALGRGIPFAAAMQAELLRGACDRQSMLALLDALHAALSTQSSVPCLSRNMASNQLGELYAHTDALPMTAHFAAVLLPGALQLSDGMRRDTPAGRDTRTLSQMRRQRERAWWDKEQAVPRSDERAMALFQDATLVPSGQAPFSAALNNLGEMHELGRHGKAPDEEKAQAYYESAVVSARSQGGGSAAAGGDERFLSNKRFLSTRYMLAGSIEEEVEEDKGLGWEKLVEGMGKKLDDMMVFRDVCPKV